MYYLGSLNFRHGCGTTAELEAVTSRSDPCGIFLTCVDMSMELNPDLTHFTAMVSFVKVFIHIIFNFILHCGHVSVCLCVYGLFSSLLQHSGPWQNIIIIRTATCSSTLPMGRVPNQSGEANTPERYLFIRPSYHHHITTLGTQHLVEDPVQGWYPTMLCSTHKPIM